MKYIAITKQNIKHKTISKLDKIEEKLGLMMNLLMSKWQASAYFLIQLIGYNLLLGFTSLFLK